MRLNFFVLYIRLFLLAFYPQPPPPLIKVVKYPSSADEFSFRCTHRKTVAHDNHARYGAAGSHKSWLIQDD